MPILPAEQFLCGAATCPGDFKPPLGGSRKMRHRCDCAVCCHLIVPSKDLCWFSAVTSQDHEQTPNASRELLDWLKQQKIREPFKKKTQEFRIWSKTPRPVPPYRSFRSYFDGQKKLFYLGIFNTDSCSEPPKKTC